VVLCTTEDGLRCGGFNPHGRTERVCTWWAHTGGGNALAFKLPPGRGGVSVVTTEATAGERSRPHIDTDATRGYAGWIGSDDYKDASTR
jgi:hypothetical protein